MESFAYLPPVFKEFAAFCRARIILESRRAEECCRVITAQIYIDEGVKLGTLYPAQKPWPRPAVSVILAVFEQICKGAGR